MSYLILGELRGFSNSKLHFPASFAAKYNHVTKFSQHKYNYNSGGMSLPKGQT